MTKTFVDTSKFTEMVSKKQQWIVNPDKSFTDILVEGLTINWNRYGYYLCPCRDSEGSRELDADVLCPCRYAKTDIEIHGHCYCSLFLSQDFKDSGKTPNSIAERRGTVI